MKDIAIKRISLGLAAGVVLAMVALIPASVSAKPAWAVKSNESIKDLVVANPNFDVLEAAVVSADLAGALDGRRQYTVFAPTDEAFKTLLNKTTEAEAITAVQGMDKDALADILLFHVTYGRRISPSVLAAPSYKMVNGDRLTRTQLLNAGIAQTDISARNGIVHVINGVLLPPAN